MNDIQRAVYLMNVASQYIRENCPDRTIHYDEADCDGSCLAEDLDTQAHEIAGEN